MLDDPRFKPQLAETCEDISRLRYPLLVSPKVDGYRAIWYNGVFYSRNLKPIPNLDLKARMLKVTAKYGQSQAWNGLDGELVVSPATGPGVFKRTSSVVTTADADAVDVRFHIFDSTLNPDHPFAQRYHNLPQGDGLAFRIPHTLVETPSQLQEFNEWAVKEGYEGSVARDPAAAYKWGRGTIAGQQMLRFKSYIDAEFRVTGFVERFKNNNPMVRDALGYADRSSHQANLSPMGTLGAMEVDYNGQVARAGTGWTDEEALEIWTNQDKYLGRLGKFKFYPTVKDLPRSMVWLGWRDVNDT